MNNKPTRVGAIIETSKGIVSVVERQDRRPLSDLSDSDSKLELAITFRDVMKELGKKKEVERLGKKIKRLGLARLLMQQGRDSLPGGGIEEIDCELANATSLITGYKNTSSPEGKPRVYLIEPKTDNEIELYTEVVRQAICREISEELDLIVDKRSITPVMEIQGRARDHIICLVRTMPGEIKLDTKELTGIGFLTDQPVIPLNRRFYQGHIFNVYDAYIRIDPRKRAENAMNYLSQVRIGRNLINGWNERQQIGYEYATSRGYKPSKPLPITSQPNFIIIGSDDLPEQSEHPGSFTSVATAKIVPPDKSGKSK